MLLNQQQQLVKQQQEALEMALLAKQQAEIAANTAAEQALKKAEAMKRRITPPAKPGPAKFSAFLLNAKILLLLSIPSLLLGKVNIVVQTDRSIPPHAIMKRRKKPDGSKASYRDDREECGGVGSESVAAPAIVRFHYRYSNDKEFWFYSRLSNV